MLPDWESFLKSQGANIENGLVLDFGDADQEAKSAEAGNVVTDLSFLAMVRIHGPDALTFLNGQFTCDLSRFANGNVSPCAWCNPKGQVIANFIIAELDDGYYLLLPRKMKDSFIKRLSMYILRAQVSIEDCSDSLQCIGYRHKDGEQISGIEISQRISTREQAYQANGLVMFHIPGNWNRVIISGAVETLKGAWLNLVQMYRSIGSRYWQLFDVQEGQPWIGTETSESCLPQLLNLDLQEGLSFQKGCFPGQEVIARLHYRGKTRQRLFIATLDSSAILTPGEKIYSENGEQSIGMVINTACHPDNGILALISLDVNISEPEKLHLQDKNVRFVKLSLPPYVTRYEI